MSSERIVVRYSEAFKRKVVAELDAGRFASVGEAAKRYGVAGSETVKKWVRRYGKNPLLGRIVRVESTEERDELKRLRERVRMLEALAADARAGELLALAHLQLACEASGLDIEDFKKKQSARRS